MLISDPLISGQEFYTLKFACFNMPKIPVLELQLFSILHRVALFCLLTTTSYDPKLFSILQPGCGWRSVGAKHQLLQWKEVSSLPSNCRLYRRGPSELGRHWAEWIRWRMIQAWVKMDRLKFNWVKIIGQLNVVWVEMGELKIERNDRLVKCSDFLCFSDLFPAKN